MWAPALAQELEEEPDERYGHSMVLPADLVAFASPGAASDQHALILDDYVGFVPDLVQSPARRRAEADRRRVPREPDPGARHGPAAARAVDRHPLPRPRRAARRRRPRPAERRTRGGRGAAGSGLRRGRPGRGGRGGRGGAGTPGGGLAAGVADAFRDARTLVRELEERERVVVRGRDATAGRGPGRPVSSSIARTPGWNTSSTSPPATRPSSRAAYRTTSPSTLTPSQAESSRSRSSTARQYSFEGVSACIGTGISAAMIDGATRGLAYSRSTTMPGCSR